MNHRAAQPGVQSLPQEDALEQWAKGYGVIRHSPRTQHCIHSLLNASPDEAETIVELLQAADRVASAAMWLVVHQTYTRRVRVDGSELAQEEFKPDPEGHTGGSLNMVPAYVGYMTANAISGLTRSWLMGQGHCVAAIDSVNVLLDNMSPKQEKRYGWTDDGLSRYVQDFYSYKLNAEGQPDSPLGSHVGIHTGGGILEGGYLGFAELQYVHMPLPGERLVAFLSDGAFEEQRGGDWAARWWRPDDCGIVTPILINNGRRIDQRTTMSMQGGTDWLIEHLKLNGFDPLVFDGRDPCCFAWAILELERRLAAAVDAIKQGRDLYPIRLPYGIAVAPKGAGFYGEGTNLAHNLPLPANPSKDARAAAIFNKHAKHLWVEPEELLQATATLRNHWQSNRPRERDHFLAHRSVHLRTNPDLEFHEISRDRSTTSRPMEAIDSGFLRIVRANSHLRPRVGNPDEMKSNRMVQTLEALKFRVTAPEVGVPESIHGSVITALNEEAVACAALGNKGGLNIVVTYEAFATKMYGAFRQEITFAQHAKGAGKPPEWLSVPLVLTSHTWENAKNEISHQDPSMGEVMLGESSDVSRVLFPADFNTAAMAIREVYETNGQIWTLVVPKGKLPNLFDRQECLAFLRDGGYAPPWLAYRAEKARAVIIAVGAYQLVEAIHASQRLTERMFPHRVVYLLEPGRFRAPRSEGERTHQSSKIPELFPADIPARVVVSHTRPDVMLGVLHPLNTGNRTVGLGFINQGGTLDVHGLLFVNRSSWAHIVRAVARVANSKERDLLTIEESEALDGQRSPKGVILPKPSGT